MQSKTNVLSQCKRCLLWPILLIVTAQLLGCAPTKPKLENLDQIIFFDSSSFDTTLSKQLKTNPPAFTVTFTAPVTLNSIPKRLDKWLAKVEEYGGKVKLQADSTAKKGLADMVLGFAVGAYQFVKEAWIYGPVAHYNATLYYRSESGALIKVVFARK